MIFHIGSVYSALTCPTSSSADLQLHGLDLLVHDYQRLLFGEGDDPDPRRIVEMAGKAEVHIFLRVDEFLETHESPLIFFKRDGNPILIKSDLGLT